MESNPLQTDVLGATVKLRTPAEIREANRLLEQEEEASYKVFRDSCVPPNMTMPVWFSGKYRKFTPKEDADFNKKPCEAGWVRCILKNCEGRVVTVLPKELYDKHLA